jgi:hypothetical protein
MSVLSQLALITTQPAKTMTHSFLYSLVLNEILKYSASLVNGSLRGDCHLHELI